MDWWIGRIVKDGCKLKLIPSAHNIESVRRAQLKKLISNKSKGIHEKNNFTKKFLNSVLIQDFQKV